MTTGLNGEWKWASHTPLVKGVLDLYKPRLVLELGCGLYSTPLFQRKGIAYKGIDNDLKWISQVYDELGIRIEHHDLGGIDSARKWTQLTASQRGNIGAYYQNLLTSDFLHTSVRPKLLFVDGFACTRKIAIEVLKPCFDIIIYHDSQPKRGGLFNHAYNQHSEHGFVKYHLATQRNWTSVMVRVDKGMSALIGAVTPYIEEFYSKWDQDVQMRILQL